MGMFVTLKLDEKCPNCGSKIEWQTKDLTIKKGKVNAGLPTN